MKLDDIVTVPVFVPAKASFYKKGTTYSAVYKGIWINKLSISDIAILKEHANEELKVESRVADSGTKYYVLTILEEKEEENGIA